MKSQTFLWSAASVALGAMIGALMRWGLCEWLNPKYSLMPLGTLLCNWLGCFFIGLALAWISSSVTCPYVKLFLVTGLLGALSTFSAFSAESIDFIATGAYVNAFWHSLFHFAGSLVLTFFGFHVWRFFH